MGRDRQRSRGRGGVSASELRFLDAEQDEDGASSGPGSDTEDTEELAFGSSDEEEDEQACDQAGPSAPPPFTPPQQPGKKITLRFAGKGADLTCHVCGRRGHSAGFVGATYYDCPNKPCYLCGQPGHSTATCPYRTHPGHGCRPAANAGSSTGQLSLDLARRQRGRVGPAGEGGWAALAPGRDRWRVDAAVLRLHAKRVTCLEFHPLNNSIVLSGSKGGGIAVWNMDRVTERTVYRDINMWLTSGLKFLPGGGGVTCASASQDGTVKVFDVETGFATELYNANPRGWQGMDMEDGSWVYLLSMDVLPNGTIVAGDSNGSLTFCDARARGVMATAQPHKRAGKIQSVAVNPADPMLLMTAGNDYTARVLDIRGLGGKRGVGDALMAPELAIMTHSKVVNSAYFSPVTGRKVLTTCQDNRIRVWDYLMAGREEPDRCIVHSNNFNRYLSPFRAEWDPKDPAERLIICGRYISEDFGGAALHPVDLLDAATGELVGELVDPNLTTISPVNKPHPRTKTIVSGSSRSLFVWRPIPEEELEEEQGLASGSGLSWLPRGHDFDSFDAAEDGEPPAKKKKAQPARTEDAGEQGKKRGAKKKPAGKDS